jgi:hypothetical protein
MRIPVRVELYEVTQESALNPRFRKSINTFLTVSLIPSTVSDLGNAIFSYIESKNFTNGMEKKKEEIEVNGFRKTESDALPTSIIEVSYTVYVAPKKA